MASEASAASEADAVTAPAAPLRRPGSSTATTTLPTPRITAPTRLVWATAPENVADRYRLLLSLSHRSVTMGSIRERLGRVHESGLETFPRGLDDGTFVTPLPTRALGYVLEGILFAVMEAVNDGVVPAEKAGRSTAITFLTAAGLPASQATELVTGVADRRAAATDGKV